MGLLLNIITQTDKICSGADLAKAEGSLTKLLCDQIFTLPIHWAKATAFPDNATHAVDFGPGALSGIGGLTARNWEGRGIRTLVVGDKGKGDLELYRATKVQYDEWWRKKFAPKLVRTAYVHPAPLILAFGTHTPAEMASLSWTRHSRVSWARRRLWSLA